ncbi:lipase family protein [Paenibacillus silvae]|uniref:lipase family protein n=1 Tax=Paenibacillus silvae TaxID=1325358 RepID=UPI003CE687D8
MAENSSPGKLNLTDQDYQQMSEAAYSDYVIGEDFRMVPGWEVLDQKHNKSGMDAVTFYNPDTQQAVIAFRGTEGSATWDRMAPDLATDVFKIGLPEIWQTAGRTLDNLRFPAEKKISNQVEKSLGLESFGDWLGDTEKSLNKSLGSKNQLYEAEDYVKEMQKKYPEASFTLTGHSLGGGNAQYAAVYTGLEAVTFSAPTVVATLTPEMQRKAEEGGFDRQVTNFIHPGDFIASGMLGGYERHVGSTFVIDQNYDEFNTRYGLEAWKKWNDTLKDPNYHDMEHYKFDDDGYVSNTLYDEITGEQVGYSPRKPSDHSILDHAREAWDTMSKGLKSVVNIVGGYSAGTIELTPEELREVAQKWSQQAQDMSRTFERIQRNFFEYTESSHSKRLVPIVWDLQMSIKQLDEWHLEHTSDLVDYIQNKADLFVKADGG